MIPKRRERGEACTLTARRVGIQHVELPVRREPGVGINVTLEQSRYRTPPSPPEQVLSMRRFAALLYALTFAAPCAVGQELPAPRINTEMPFAISEAGPDGGFGTQTRGGLDGRIIRVTHLEDEGKGSLRMALEALKGPRTVVFEVSGQFNLKRDIIIRHPHITIAGHTAPSPGVTIANATIRVSTHDVVIQHLRCRVGNLPGKESLEDRDGIQLVGVKLEPDAKEIPKPHIYNVVIDHCSISWTCDEGISTYFHGIRDVTVRNTIIAEPLDKAGHPKGGHSMALLIGAHSKNVTILGNLFAHSRYRNPVVKGNTTTIVANNVMYDIGSNAFHSYGGEGGPSLATAVANVLLAGPTRRRESKNKEKPAAPDFYIDRTTRNNWTNEGSQFFLSQNRVPEGSHEAKRLLEYDVFAVKPPVTLDSLKILPVDKVQDYVLRHAGARPQDRDAVDLRIIEEVRTGGGRIINTQDDVGGWPKLAENRHELNPPVELQADDDKNGKNNLEQWLDEYRKRVE